jgi:hypothetical protein
MTKAAKKFAPKKKPAPLNTVKYAPGAKRTAIEKPATEKPARENTATEKLGHAKRRMSAQVRRPSLAPHRA